MMSQDSKEMNENTTSLTNGAERHQTSPDGSNSNSKTLRHPRWSREEIFVLIEGKTFIENQLHKKGRKYGSSLSSDHCEPKWDLVSSYCKQHAVNKGAYQCQKRWSNLICDFRKIKIWETQKKGEAESFWRMRNDLRKERKLPGFFDREVYEILDKKMFSAAAIPLATVVWTADMQKGEGSISPLDKQKGDSNERPAEAAFENIQRAEEGLFPVSVQFTTGKIGSSQQKETNLIDSPPEKLTTALPIPEIDKEEQPRPDTIRESPTQERLKTRESVTHERLKRRRLSLGGTCNEDQWTRILERNNNMMEAQLRAYNVNCQLARQQQMEDTDRLAAALSKLSDTLVKIADKL